MILLTYHFFSNYIFVEKYFCKCTCGPLPLLHQAFAKEIDVVQCEFPHVYFAKKIFFFVSLNYRIWQSVKGDYNTLLNFVELLDYGNLYPSFLFPQLRETDANLGKSSRILTGMLRR